MTAGTNVIQDGSYYQYWKGTDSTSLWTRPNVSSNNDPRFRLTPSGEWSWHSSYGASCWYAFDGNYSTGTGSYRDGGGFGTAYIQMDTPEPLRITGYNFTGLYNSNNYNVVYQFVVWRYNSGWVELYNSGMNWWRSDSVNIRFGNSGYSTTYKLQISCPGGSSQDCFSVTEIVPIATTYVINKVDESTAGAYTTTHNNYKSFKQDSNYYGLSHS